MLKIGDRIPDFELVTDRGERVSPKSLKGTRTLLYFYPKDDTPGCTTEACAFRDAMPKFDSAKLRIYGISADDDKRHAKFVAKHALNFPLIADPERHAIEGFGVWVEKSLYGRKYMGIARATFAIDANGKVEQVWDKVKPKSHADEVLAWATGAATTPAR
ncbi:MAG: thioredoxin-dependent thiol peroxidase [Rhodanobacteraceae bacterium]|jgi:peroxiredoxin Q/BCP|nr:thioredoxin-dependent thiol peroxidase [Rhodanobacteraceae bacterium]MBK7043688.1 thioredoxin-dependent thiol peroxidase [Rhodanobacteraceae bacterium]MBP9155705.1 thioredoxin-dependent thiol peroxidase [Xanthomonadales bacterium]HQW80774.1 thioredoxin-dependent thiol peroxidase [Pseudomonadota bacterium]